MIKFDLNPGKGAHYKDRKLTLNFSSTNRIPVEKRSDGLYVQGTGGSGVISGLIDQDTLVNTGDGNIIGINRDIVACAYLMCQYKVATRTTKATYSIDTAHNKSINDIVGELNAVQDAYSASGTDIPMGMAKTGYILKANDIFGLRTTFQAMQVEASIGGQSYIWPCAMDSGNRSENDTLSALFVVKSTTYTDKYLTGLTLECLWSNIADYEKGETYVYS